jgi:hypothetical protein
MSWLWQGVLDGAALVRVALYMVCLHATNGACAAICGLHLRTLRDCLRAPAIEGL